jgi:DNA-binding response OmpR family regulator
MAGKRILVIDDEPDIVDFLTTLFEDHGFETRSAHNGTEGLARAREQVPDLITLDVTMPGKSGVAIFKELRADPDLCRVPVFIITGVHEFRQMMYSQSALPPEGYMEKPVDPERLVRDVKEILKLQ